MFFMLNRPETFGWQWSKHYEGWKEKAVYTIRLDSPQPPLSYEEYLGEHEDTPLAREKYKVEASPQYYIAYPEEDLQSLENEDELKYED